jgi:MerR family transcriptional regulator, heat shock protein HspR
VARLPIDDENLPLFTVGQVSAMLEVQQAFLRRLDQFDVVQPSRSSGGQRRYTRREITVVQYVLELIGDGMTLAGVRRVLQLETRVRQLEAQADRMDADRDQLRAQRDELRVQYDELRAQRDDLRALLEDARAEAAEFRAALRQRNALGTGQERS